MKVLIFLKDTFMKFLELVSGGCFGGGYSFPVFDWVNNNDDDDDDEEVEC